MSRKRFAPFTPYRDALVAFSVIFFASVLALWILLSFSWFISIIGGLNLAVWLLFGYDKMLAGGGRARIPEYVFYVLTLVGGTLGALAGMILFRHKTQKLSFQAVIALIVALQIILAVYFLKKVL